MKFYKGDTVQNKTDKNGNTIDMLWGTEIIGVIKNVECDSFVLFHRPILNKVKHLLWRIFKICL